MFQRPCMPNCLYFPHRSFLQESLSTKRLSTQKRVKAITDRLYLPAYYSLHLELVDAYDKGNHAEHCSNKTRLFSTKTLFRTQMCRGERRVSDANIMHNLHSAPCNGHDFSGAVGDELRTGEIERQ